MSVLKLALMQLSPESTLDGNLQKGLRACRIAKQELGADIVLFPELWSVGYRIPQDPAELNRSAVRSDSVFVRSFGALAAELNMAIGITFLETYDPSPRNTICLFDRFGKPALTYAKVHTCDFGSERVLTAGDAFYVTDLDTAQGTVKVGAMICFDREFPESARILMLKGAEIILVPNACPMEINRLSQLRARAYENMAGLVTVNYPEGHLDCNGCSSVFDGVAYDSDGSSRDMLNVLGSGKEGIYPVDFPLDELRAYRSSEVHGNAYRHPQKYKLLVSEQIEAPFLRDDYRK